MAEKNNKEYIAVVGLDHVPSDTRIEAGEPVVGLPDDVVKALLEQGAIEPKPDPKPVKKTDEKKETKSNG